MSAATRINPRTRNGELKHEAYILLTGIALGLTTDQTASQVGWSTSKVSRWRSSLQDDSGLNVLALVVKLINEKNFSPIGFTGHFNPSLGHRLHATISKLAEHPVNPRERRFLIKSFAGYPTHTGWTTNNCPDEMRALMRKAGISPPESTSLSGIYALILAAAAHNDQLCWEDLPKTLTVSTELQLPDGIRIVITGPPGAHVDARIDITLPTSAGPAE